MENFNELSNYTLINFGADPFIAMDSPDALETLKEEVKNYEVHEHTKDNTDEYEWGVLCSNLDLDVNKAHTIYTYNNGVEVIFSDDWDY